MLSFVNISELFSEGFIWKKSYQLWKDGYPPGSHRLHQTVIILFGSDLRISELSGSLPKLIELGITPI